MEASTSETIPASLLLYALQRSKIIQDDVLSLTDIDNIFIATNAQASPAKVTEIGWIEQIMHK